MANKVDAVFEGGGVKGIGLVGAVAVTEAAGYQFENVAGTSAGAIVASLVAAGYNANELKRIIEELDYNNFKDRGFIDKIPLIGEALSLGFEKGIFEGDYFENWLRDLLQKKGVYTFGDLIMPEYQDHPDKFKNDPDKYEKYQQEYNKYRYKLQVIATDISNSKLLVLPWDLVDYGIEPDKFDVASAVRMSMSIPLFFEPVVLKDKKGNNSYIVDGGVLSNFPIWIFDDGTDNPLWPTFGYKLVEPDEMNKKPHNIRGPISLLAAMISTMMDAHDARYIKDKAFACTIPIPTLGIGTTEFDITPERSSALYQSGVTAAEDFLSRWNFEKFKDKYRKNPDDGHRRDKV